MTTEAEVSLDVEPPEVIEETGFEHYREIGGKLDEDCYQHALLELQNVPQDVMQNPNHVWWGENIAIVNINQAKLYARVAGIELSPEQVFLYCLLRKPKPPMPKPGEKPVSGPKVCTIDDKALLDEVLLMTNDIVDCDKFKAANPIVFPPR